jgi:hypothetical protein
MTAFLCLSEQGAKKSETEAEKLRERERETVKYKRKK